MLRRRHQTLRLLGLAFLAGTAFAQPAPEQAPVAKRKQLDILLVGASGMIGSRVLAEARAATA